MSSSADDIVPKSVYDGFQSWWKTTGKKVKTLPRSELFYVRDKPDPYVRVPDEFKANFPGDLLKFSKEGPGPLKLYGLTTNNEVEQLKEHVLTDLRCNPNGVKRNKYSYAEGYWVTITRVTISLSTQQQPTQPRQPMGPPPLRPSSGPSQLVTPVFDPLNPSLASVAGNTLAMDVPVTDAGAAMIGVDEVLERVLKHPRLESYIAEKIREGVEGVIKEKADLVQGMVRQSLSSDDIMPLLQTQVHSIMENRPDRLHGTRRVVARKEKQCAWRDALPLREHNDNVYWIPLEVFSHYDFKFSATNAANPTLALTNARQYAVCQRCHDNTHERELGFFNARARATVCAICKRRDGSNKNHEGHLPLCKRCLESGKAGSIDRDWDKQLIQYMMEPVINQFPDLNMNANPEQVAPNPEASGAGNHNKRIDALIHFRAVDARGGSHRKKDVAILIELDDQQKGNKNAEDTREDIRTVIKKKVAMVNTALKPDVLVIWKVNHNANFTTSTMTVRDLGMYARMIILRQYVLFLIYHWHEMPRQSVWYFWYDHDKARRIQDHWTTSEDERKYVSFLWYPPHDPEHTWHYCVDPCEGGCDYKSKTKTTEESDTQMTESTQATQSTQTVDKDKNPYNKIIVDKRRVVSEMLNHPFPAPKEARKFEFSIMKED
jgi:hypothetical protein